MSSHKSSNYNAFKEVRIGEVMLKLKGPVRLRGGEKSATQLLENFVKAQLRPRFVSCLFVALLQFVTFSATGGGLACLRSSNYHPVVGFWPMYFPSWPAWGGQDRTRLRSSVEGLRERPIAASSFMPGICWTKWGTTARSFSCA